MPNITCRKYCAYYRHEWKRGCIMYYVRIPLYTYMLAQAAIYVLLIKVLYIEIFPIPNFEFEST